MEQNIQNPGSALGEAIGAEMEKALNVFLKELIEGIGYHYISKGFGQSKNGKERKLFMYDRFGNAYNIDAVIANVSMQPMILIESKYIRYTKHNRDKGSWICTAHPAVRRRYPSLRSSIAVLAGNWSASSKAMLRSYDINIFLIPFQRICDLLAEYSIDFRWAEKDRVTAQRSLDTYISLSASARADIGVAMVMTIRDELQSLVLKILDDTIERDIKRITVDLHSNLGEVKTYEFNAIDSAVEFLNQIELTQVFISSDSPTLFDPPPTFDNK